MSTAMPNVKYGKITGKFYKVLGDGIDPDRYPDGIPEQGLTIEFKTSVKRWKSAVNKAFYYPETVVAFTNSSGVLVDSEGAEGIYLIATDQPGDVLNPREATWTCTIRRDRTVLETFNFLVPSGSEVDLADVAPVTASGGVQIVSGPRGLPGEKGEKGDPGTASPEDIARAFEDEDSAARITLNAAIGEHVWDVLPSAADLTDASAVFIAAATAAHDAGRKVLRVAPGTYNVPGLHPDDIHDIQVVGDGVTLTGPAWLYPFSESEWNSRGRVPTTSGGRGVLAIQLDDGRLDHWTDVFPVTKELGITISNALHTGGSSSSVAWETGWYKEALRHGWELSSHLPDNIAATSVSLSRFEELLNESLDVLEEVTGTREGHGFVYPQGARSAETDRIAAKYHTYGRKVTADFYPYARGEGHPWLVVGREIDVALEYSGGVHPDLRDELASVAAMDGQIVYYFHYQRALNGPAKLDGLRALVNYARSLGMEIRNPNQVWGETRVQSDPFDLREAWVLQSGAERVTSTAYHGSKSVKLPSGGIIIPAARANLSPRPGCFTVLRVGYRIKTAGFTSSGGINGVRLAVAEVMRTTGGELATVGGVQPAGCYMPPEGSTTSGAKDWEAVRDYIYLQPSTVRAAFRVLATGTSGGDVFIDDLDVHFVTYQGSVTYDITLNGTTPVSLRTTIPNIARCGLSVAPSGSWTPAGTIRVRADNNSSLVVSSSSTSDTSVVRVSVTPGPTYSAWTVSSTGA